MNNANGLKIAVSSKTHEESIKWLLFFYQFNFVIAILYLAISWIQFFYPVHYAYIISTTVYTLSLTGYNIISKYSRKIYGNRIKKKKGEIWVIIWIVNIIVMLYWQLNSDHYIGFETWNGFAMIAVNYILGRIAKYRNKKLKFVSVV